MMTLRWILAYTMPVEDFKKAKDLVMGLIADDIDATADADDVFAAVGLADIKSAKILELERHLQLMREIKHKALKPPLPPSLSYWCTNGVLMPKLRRVYMNLGSVVMGSIPSEAVFNQLKLIVGDRRGSMLDARSENLTFSSVLAKLDEEDSSRPSNLGDMTPEELWKSSPSSRRSSKRSAVACCRQSTWTLWRTNLTPLRHRCPRRRQASASDSF